jgi:hypothetical protein
MSIIWDSGFKRKVEAISAPIEIPPSLPLVREEIIVPVEKDVEEFKGFGR